MHSKKIDMHHCGQGIQKQQLIHFIPLESLKTGTHTDDKCTDEGSWQSCNWLVASNNGIMNATYVKPWPFCSGLCSWESYWDGTFPRAESV